MFKMHVVFIRLFVVLLAVATLGGCDRQGGQEQATAEASARSTPLPASTWFPLGLGEKTIQVQLAIAPAEQAQGLMGRKSLDTDHGMLFVFDRGRRQSFWMANTPLPLDIGYFDNEGILREVYPLYPFDRTAVPSQRSDIRYALEMSEGWFSRNNVRPGARINLQMLDAALKQRR